MSQVTTGARKEDPYLNGYLAGQLAMRDMIAAIVEGTGQHYSTEFFKHTDDSCPDCIAAKMGRHLTKVLVEQIRALKPEEPK